MDMNCIRKDIFQRNSPLMFGMVWTRKPPSSHPTPTPNNFPYDCSPPFSPFITPYPIPLTTPSTKLCGFVQQTAVSVAIFWLSSQWKQPLEAGEEERVGKSWFATGLCWAVACLLWGSSTGTDPHLGINYGWNSTWVWWAIKWWGSVGWLRTNQRAAQPEHL